QISNDLASQMVQVRKDANNKPTITTFTMMSALRNMPQGDRSRGNVAVATLGAAAGGVADGSPRVSPAGAGAAGAVAAVGDGGGATGAAAVVAGGDGASCASAGTDATNIKATASADPAHTAVRVILEITSGMGLCMFRRPS